MRVIAPDFVLVKLGNSDGRQDADALQGYDLPKIKTATFFEPERDNLLSCNDGILLHKESFREQL